MLDAGQAAVPDPRASSTLTVSCRGGLANRLRVLVSGLALAEATGRTFTMLWARTRHCAAAFGELFANDWPVREVDAAEPSPDRHAIYPWRDVDGRQLLTDERPHIFVEWYTWLVRPDDESMPRASRRCAALLAELGPIPSLSERVAAFRASHFRPTMIGVHLRRGDFVHWRPHLAGNTPEAMAAVDRLLEVAPEAGILVCSDDGAHATRPEGVREQFVARYGPRAVWVASRSLDRRTVDAIEDAVVDLWLLRQTDVFVGTAGSSFSELAVAARDVPHVFLSGGVPAYRPFAPLAHVPKLHGLVLRAFRLADRFRR